MASPERLCLCNQKRADISCCYLPVCVCVCVCVQLDGVDILCLTVSTVELTLTLLEVPSLAVVAPVLQSGGSSRCSQGTTTEMSCILLLWLCTTKPACV